MRKVWDQFPVLTESFWILVLYTFGQEWNLSGIDEFLGYTIFSHHFAPSGLFPGVNVPLVYRNNNNIKRLLDLDIFLLFFSWIKRATPSTKQHTQEWRIPRQKDVTLKDFIPTERVLVSFPFLSHTHWLLFGLYSIHCNVGISTSSLPLLLLLLFSLLYDRSMQLELLPVRRISRFAGMKLAR